MTIAVFVGLLLTCSVLYVAFHSARTDANDAWRHSTASEGVRVELVRALERSKRQAQAYLDVARMHKKKRDMYRHQLREANRKIRHLQAELNESIKMKPSSDELAQQMALQAATAAPYQPFLPYGAREIRIKSKVG